MNTTSVINFSEKKYINDFDAWKIYHTTRLHFNTVTYSVEKYGFNNKNYDWEAYQKASNWEVRFFDKWAKQFTYNTDMEIAIGAFFFYYKPSAEWFADPLGVEVTDSYNKLKQCLYSPKYFLDQDLTYLTENYTIDVLKIVKGNIPKIYHLAHKGEISYESLAIIDLAISLTKYVSTQINSLTWKAYKDTYIKYRPFVATSIDEEFTAYIKTQLLTMKVK